MFGGLLINSQEVFSKLDFLKSGLTTEVGDQRMFIFVVSVYCYFSLTLFDVCMIISTYFTMQRLFSFAKCSECYKFPLATRLS